MSEREKGEDESEEEEEEEERRYSSIVPWAQQAQLA